MYELKSFAFFYILTSDATTYDKQPTRFVQWMLVLFLCFMANNSMFEVCLLFSAAKNNAHEVAIKTDIMIRSLALFENSIGLAFWLVLVIRRYNFKSRVIVNQCVWSKESECFVSIKYSLNSVSTNMVWAEVLFQLLTAFNSVFIYLEYLFVIFFVLGKFTSGR